MRFIRGLALAAAGAAAVSGAGTAATASARTLAQRTDPPFISRFQHTSQVASTVPANGDVNPYGVAVVHHREGRLHRGDILVSNFNNSSNLQGTGSTIVDISPDGATSLFAQISGTGLPGPCPGGIGLTTALVIMHGWVIVGSLPSEDGTAATSSAGCLLVLDSLGQVRETISGQGINGPWDAAAVVHGQTGVLFVSNVLNGTVAGMGSVVNGGTVLRLTLIFSASRLPRLGAVTEIGSGFAERTDPAAFVIGPTGLGLGPSGSLYVADTEENRITMINNAVSRGTSAGTGVVLTSGRRLNSPLGLAIAPGGDVLTVNGGDGRIVETTPAGAQVADRFLDTSGSPPGNGALFGLAVTLRRNGVYYVDDAENTLRLLH